MSANGDTDEVPGREIAYRLFAAEYDDASLSYAESDEERAPNYVITPTGARLNRLFVAGTLTEVTSVNDEMVRARVVDPTGAFVVYAGQYQPDELAFLEQIEPPAFVAVTGKARTFQPEDADRVYTSIRPESIATIDADTRDRWVVSAAEQTLERIGTYAGGTDLDVSAEPRSADSRAATPQDSDGDALAETLREAGVESGLADGIPLAQDHYGTTPAYLAALRDCALEAVEVVAGDRDQVGGLQFGPDETSPEYEMATVDSLTELASVEPAAPGTAEDAPSDEPISAAVGADGQTSAVGTADTASNPTGEASADDPVTQGDAEVETESETGLETASDADLEAGTSEAPDPSNDSIGSSETGVTTAADEVDDRDAEPARPGTESDDSTGVPDSSDEATDEDPDDFGSGMYEMDDDEREQLEAEFGAEFTTGAEVEDPGEADIDVPEPESESESASESKSESTESDTDRAESPDTELGAAPASTLESDSADSATDTSTADAALEPESESEDTTEEPTEAIADDTAETASEGGDEAADDVDLQAAVVETMQELDDGDGADRSELVETVAADTGATEANVEGAIEDALMGGQCYEPDDETLKAI